MARGHVSQGEPSGELAVIRGLIAEAVPREEWLSILKQLAQSGNPKAIELLLKYRFGPPVAHAEKRPQADKFVQLLLPMIEGSTYGADAVEAARGAAVEISPKRGGRGPIRRGGRRRQE